VHETQLALGWAGWVVAALALHHLASKC